MKRLLSTKNKLLLSIFSFFGFILLVGISYAFYSTVILGNDLSKITKFINTPISITYSGNTELIESDVSFTPGASITKTFSVTNDSSNPFNFSISLVDVSNTFTRTDDITYTLELGNEELITEAFPTDDKIIVYGQRIKGNETLEYTLTINYINDPEENQIVDSGSEIGCKLEFNYVQKSWDNFIVYGNNLNALPNEYQLLEYIEGTGPQYIDTGVSTTGIGIKAETKVMLTTSSNSEMSVIGRTAGGGFDMLFRGGDVIRVYNTTDQSVTSPTNYTQNTLYTITGEVGTNSIYINVNGNENTYTGTVTERPVGNIVLFRHNSNYNFTGRMYYTKIWNNGTLVRHLVPCTRKSDSVVGMYDLITKTFYTNAGTGNFTAGISINSYRGNEYTELPENYSKVEYLESSGTQYIDTGIPSMLGKFEIDFARVDTTTSSIIMGNIIPNTASNSFVSSNTYNIMWQIGGNINNRNWTFDTNKHKVIANITTTQISVNFDGNTQVTNGTTTINNLNVYLFGRNSNGTFATSGSIRIYGLKHWDSSGTLTRNLVPSVRNSDGTLGMYDSVNNTFYTNKGAGEFITGDRESSNVGDYVNYSSLPTGYNELNYIESTGTQYINTGLYATKNTKVDLDFSVDHINNGTTYRIMGVRSGQNSNAFIMGKNGVNDPILFAQFDSVSHTLVKNITPVAKKRTNLVLSKDGFYVDGVKSRTFSNPSSFTTTNTVILFGFYNNTSELNLATQSLKIYKAKFYENDTLVMNLVPCYRESDGEVGMYDTVNGTFLTNAGTGTFIKGGSPYKYVVPINVRTKNMFNIDDDFSDASNYSSGNGYYGHRIKLKPNTEYTISISKNNRNRYIVLSVGQSYNPNNYSNNFWLSHVTNDNSTYNIYPNSKKSFTTDNSGYIWINVSGTASTIKNNLMECLESIQIEEGSTATNYTPYYKTVNIYLDEPLRRVGEYADYIDLKNGKLVRQIGKLEINGSESWNSTVSSVTSKTIFYYAFSNTALPHVAPILSNYTGSNSFWSNLTDKKATVYGGVDKSLYIRDDSYTTTADFKAHLQDLYNNGNPLTMYYVLPESKYTEEDISNKLSVIENTGYVVIGTNVEPGEVNIN